MSPQIEPPHLTADKDLLLSGSCNTDELLHPLDPHLKGETEVVAAAELTKLFPQPVWITASPLTCLGLVEPEHQREK